MPAYVSSLTTQTKIVDFAICFSADRNNDNKDSNLNIDKLLYNF